MRYTVRWVELVGDQYEQLRMSETCAGLAELAAHLQALVDNTRVIKGSVEVMSY